jgi:PhoH-like ATPase
MRTVYILDTCVLISDPKAFQKYPNQDIVIPITVLDELDKLKQSHSEASKNARIAIRNLDALCQLGQIHKGVTLEDGTTVKIDTFVYDNNFGSDAKMDDKILACALAISKNRKTKPTTLVSRDINLRVRANAFNIAAEDYERTSGNTEELYSGFTDISNEKLGYALLDNNWADAKNFKEVHSLLPNQCVHVTNSDGGGMALARKIETKNEIRLKKLSDRKVWGLESKSKEQAMALDLLMDTKVPMVTLVGKAGTGKSLLAVAAAMELVLEQKKYDKILLFKPVNPIDKNQELGFLPGTLEDKLSESYASYFDAFEYLFSNGKKNADWQRSLEIFMEKGIINMEGLAFLRGRSFANSIIILDELQNLPTKMLLTILSRCSQNTKIVLLGDLEQIDSNIAFDENALYTAVESFKHSELTGHITLTKCERSALAELAIKTLS